MVPWGTGDPISPGYLNTQVFLTGKPPPLSVSVGGGSMSPMKTQAIVQILAGMIGIILMIYGMMAAFGKAPVFSLYKLKTEKEKRRENLFHSLEE